MQRRSSRTSGDFDPGQAGPGPHSTGSTLLDVHSSADLCMDGIVDKLKLLNYEQDFCKPKRHLKPLSRTYFCLPAPMSGQNEQFFYFTSLVAWLLNLSGRSFQPPQQYDDPNMTCTNILTELREAGFAPVSFPPTKLRQGYGDAVCGILDALCDLALAKTKFTFQLPTYLAETYVEEADVNDDAEVTVNEIDDQIAAQSSDEEELYASLGTREGQNFDNTGAETVGVEAQVDPAEWRLEVERVAPRLKITVASNARDWRSHLDEAHKHSQEISTVWPGVQTALGAVQTEVMSAMEKLSTRERFLNSQCEHLTAEYREAKEALSQMQEHFNQKQDAAAELENELARVAQELETRKTELDERGSNISDSSPVVRIKAAIKSIKAELQQMSVRVGVLQHQLLQVMLAKSHERLTADVMSG
ncbi:Intraflagellar transport protein 57 [Trebouxia sp. C0010 RCD-2024]